MIPVPKPKFFEQKVPIGQSEDDYLDEISFRQTHLLEDAINRVSLYFKYSSNVNSAHLSICNGSSWNFDVAINSNCF